jgi:hypothetical protein
MLDAPGFVDVRNVVWRAETVLVYTPDAVLSRRLIATCGFTWGYDIIEGTVSVHPLDLGVVGGACLEADRRSDRGLDERLRHRLGEGVNGTPARAMSRHDNTNVHLGERRDGLADDRLEQTTREV